MNVGLSIINRLNYKCFITKNVYLNTLNFYNITTKKVLEKKLIFKFIENL